ncbi:MAG TPA: YetF domain-containing protein [Candidatus Limnocylindrales bacterium]|nr:YetF domain-containing protein [Candidatus Limnocylindrales bacterium]
MQILGFDIPAALIPDVSLFETIVRGIVVYFAIFVLLRVVLRGRTSAVTVSDLLVLVLIADAAQNAMAAEYHSVTSGLVLVTTIILCSFSVDWLAYRFPTVLHFVHPERKPLVVDGRVIRPNLRSELMTIDELWTQLRLNGIAQIEDVKAAYLEGNGEISVIKRQDGGGSGRKSKAAVGAG